MTPVLIKTIHEARERCDELRRAGRLGFVPTMGALHRGHGALIDQARQECAGVAVSIFVNPTQFDRKEDYEHYSRNLVADLEFCAERGVDLVFAPDAAEMYPSPLKTFVEVTDLSERLCGHFRPGHFRGVATVVAKLFQIVQPDVAYFGEKDAQQLAIVRRMTADLNFPVEITAVTTVREADGLALSSRNERLGQEERQIAPRLFVALEAARQAVEAGKSVNEAKQAGLATLRGIRQMNVEYFEVVDGEMQPVTKIEGPVRILVAAWLGGTRLIDNVLTNAAARA
ncbi:MAG TPA: pantoate--beta-alanine ligase [Bryobacteraceae bacterium]